MLYTTKMSIQFVQVFFCESNHLLNISNLDGIEKDFAWNFTIVKCWRYQIHRRSHMAPTKSVNNYATTITKEPQLRRRNITSVDIVSFWLVAMSSRSFTIVVRGTPEFTIDMIDQNSSQHHYQLFFFNFFNHFRSCDSIILRLEGLHGKDRISTLFVLR